MRKFLLCLLLTLSLLLPGWAQTIAIFTEAVAPVKPWDPDAIHTGITGSEEAVIYMSQELAKLGYRVIVFGSPPPGSKHSARSANPRFITQEADPYSSFDIAISWRMPTIAPFLKTRAKKIYFWPHDACMQRFPEQTFLKFDGILWISQWQREQWVSINPECAKFTHVFGNGIVPEQFEPIRERENPYSCIWGSNYAQGLEVLLDAWPTIRKQFPRATLDIYYGWQSWGLLSPEKEKKLRAQVTALAPLGVAEHGFVGHEELNRAYAKASFWTYPCALLETFCITGLRAQYAGAIPVVIPRAALGETVLLGYLCRPEQYINTLLAALQTAEELPLQTRQEMRELVLQKFTWKIIATQWRDFFNEKAP